MALQQSSGRLKWDAKNICTKLKAFEKSYYKSTNAEQ